MAMLGAPSTQAKYAGFIWFGSFRYKIRSLQHLIFLNAKGQT
jgi:hypothetical protein